jgi:hypothetical protein
MKKKIRYITIFIALSVLILLILFNTIARKTSDWNFIQSVGGIKIENPLLTENGFYLPVICNVSGLDSITIKPTGLNSALSCIKSKVTIDGNKIYLKVVNGIAFSKRTNCNCKAVNIGYLNEGIYQVYYKASNSDEHLIGQFTIKEDI